MIRKRIVRILIYFTLVFTTIFAGMGTVFADTSDGVTDAENSLGNIYPELEQYIAGELYEPFDYNAEDPNDPMVYLEHMKIFPENLTSEPATQKIQADNPGHYFYTVCVVGTHDGEFEILMENGSSSVRSKHCYLEYDEEHDAYTGMVQIENPYWPRKGSNIHSITVTPLKSYEGQYICELFTYYLPQSTKDAPLNILNKGTIFLDNPSNGYSWVKFTTTGTRNIKIEFSEEKGYGVRLYKANQKTLLGGGTVNVTWRQGLKTYYAVPKGTYYVRVYNREFGFLGVKITSSKVTEKSGATRAKAVNVGKNVLKKGTLLATETASTSSDWYKVTLKRNQKFYMHLNFRTGGIAKGGVKVSVYKKGETKPMMTKKFASGTSSHDWKIYTKNNGGKLKKGTYYIKVQKYNYGTGYYSLKWNNKS